MPRPRPSQGRRAHPSKDQPRLYSQTTLHWTGSACRSLSRPLRVQQSAQLPSFHQPPEISPSVHQLSSGRDPCTLLQQWVATSGHRLEVESCAWWAVTAICAGHSGNYHCFSASPATTDSYSLHNNRWTKINSTWFCHLGHGSLTPLKRCLITLQVSETRETAVWAQRWSLQGTFALPWVYIRCRGKLTSCENCMLEGNVVVLG